MKNRRIVIVAFILVAALTMSVGYALLSRDLKIEGKAKTTPENLNVVFSEADLIEKSDVAEGNENYTTSSAVASSSVGTPGDMAISLTASNLVKVGEKVVAKYTIKNNNQYEVRLSRPVIANTGDADAYSHFTISTDWPEGAGNDVITVAAGGTYDVVVTVTLSKPNADAVSADFTITIKASAGT